jgi:hypothetical protein
MLNRLFYNDMATYCYCRSKSQQRMYIYVSTVNVHLCINSECTFMYQQWMYIYVSTANVHLCINSEYTFMFLQRMYVYVSTANTHLYIRHWLLWTDYMEKPPHSDVSLAPTTAYTMVLQTQAISLPTYRGDPTNVVIVSEAIVLALQDPVRQDRQTDRQTDVNRRSWRSSAQGVVQLPHLDSVVQGATSNRLLR